MIIYFAIFVQRALTQLRHSIRIMQSLPQLTAIQTVKVIAMRALPI